MATCIECASWFAIPEDADDYEEGKGDCVTEKEDQKAKYWLSRPVLGSSECCGAFKGAHARVG